MHVTHCSCQNRLSFKEVKAHAIFYLLELEKQGKISRDDGFQGILNAIASDVRSKHRKRLQRQQETDSMVEALKHLNERKKYFQEQIDSYHSYVEAAMATMQRGKGCVMHVLIHNLCRMILIYSHSQEKAICSTLHQAILPHARSSKVRQVASIWLVQVQCQGVV